MTENPKHFLDSASESLQRPSKIAKTAVEELSDGEEEQQQLQQPPAQEPMSPNPRIQRYLLAIEYIGTRFSGSQQQPNFRTVVGVLEVLPEIFVFFKYFLFLSKSCILFGLESRKVLPK
jgi:tRNA pseudouridine38-40 synthase